MARLVEKCEILQEQLGDAQSMKQQLTEKIPDVTLTAETVKQVLIEHNTNEDLMALAVSTDVPQNTTRHQPAQTYSAAVQKQYKRRITDHPKKRTFIVQGRENITSAQIETILSSAKYSTQSP